MLEIKNLHARVDDKEILRGINLTVKAGEVHAIMGENGSGKSTLAGVLAGRDAYEVTAGEVLFDGKDLLDLDPEERAREGIFLAFQYPVEIPGVSNTYFLKAAVNAVRQHRGLPEYDARAFLKLVKEKVKLIHMSEDLLKRPVNEGFSGGEKKRNEIFQMAVLDPRLAILDETDSGLDIDALKAVADGVNALRAPTAPSSSSRTISGCSITSCPITFTFCCADGSSNQAAKSWRWNWRRRGTSGSKRPWPSRNRRKQRGSHRDGSDGTTQHVSGRLRAEGARIGRVRDAGGASSAQGGGGALRRVGLSWPTRRGMAVHADHSADAPAVRAGAARRCRYPADASRQSITEGRYCLRSGRSATKARRSRGTALGAIRRLEEATLHRS